MGLLKLIGNRISTEWKKTFNDNVDYLTGLEKKQDEKLDAVNSRVNNLVLHSGGESPNEVTDARVNNKGETFDTLQGRLTAAESKHDTDTQNLTTIQTDQQKQLEQLNNGIGKLLGTYGTTLDFYVSGTRGDDKNGDGTEEKPFKTLQMAANLIPLISTSNITVLVEDGAYLEDVKFTSINGSTLQIRPVSDGTSFDPSKTDCPIKIRSISFNYCTGYMKIERIQFVDVANDPFFEGTQYSLMQEQGGYLAIDRCKFAENTKSMGHYSFYCGGSSKANIYGSTYFANQNRAVYAKLLSEVNIPAANGTGNNIGVTANAATVRGTIPKNFATTASKVESTGLIITKGTVLS